MATKRSTLKNFRKAALKNPNVKAGYDALSPAFELKRQMFALRKNAGLTQEEMKINWRLLDSPLACREDYLDKSRNGATTYCIGRASGTFQRPSRTWSRGRYRRTV